MGLRTYQHHCTTNIRHKYSIIFVQLYQVIRNFIETLNISYVGDIEEIKVKKPALASNNSISQSCPIGYIKLHVTDICT